MGLNINNPIPREWEDYITQTALGLEVIPDQLYDTQTYVDNVTTNLVYYVTIPANESVGNMTQSGMLPNPESFLIQAPRIRFIFPVMTVDMAASAANLAGKLNDAALLLQSGRMLLQIGNKRYGPWKIWTMPQGSGLSAYMAAAGAEAAGQVSTYGVTTGPLFGLFPHLMIAPLQQFRVTLSWPTAVDLSADMDIEVLFDGQRARSVQ